VQIRNHNEKKTQAPRALILSIFREGIDAIFLCHLNSDMTIRVALVTACDWTGTAKVTMLSLCLLGLLPFGGGPQPIIVTLVLRGGKEGDLVA
jgi:hypothetical protein